MLKSFVFCAIFSSVFAQFGFISRVASGFSEVEIAPYTVVTEHGDGIEERLYPSKKWACTSNRSLRSPTREMFMKLFKYIDGENQPEVKVPMTAPVSTIVTPAQPGDIRSFEMCFFVPEASQENTPAPLSQDINMVTRPAITVYTRKIGGYIMSDNAWDDEANQVKAILQSKKLAADFSKYYRNGYDAPFKFWNRRNEAWFLKA